MDISGRHFMITFGKDFADTSEYRLVLRDLKSTNGTVVKYDGKGGERRSDFRWILSGHKNARSSIVIEPSKDISFQLAVFIPQIGMAGPLVEQVQRFLEPLPIDSLVGSLNVDATLKTRAFTPGPKGRLGKGGFAVVKSYWNVSTGLAFARKVPGKEFTRDDEETFRNEIELLSGLDHKHIIKCLSNPDDEELRIDFELIEGGTLEFRRGQWSFDTKVEAFRQCLEAINYLHTLPQPIIHRDIKSANILVDNTRDGICIKLADFGLAREGDDPMSILGTDTLLPPELDLTMHPRGYSMGVDIWSMGVTACDLFANIPRAKLLHKECLRFIERVEREANAQPPKESRLLRFILENMLVMDADLRKTAGQCLEALAQITFDGDDNGGGVESSQETTGKDGDGGENGGTRGSRGGHGDGDWDVPTERPRSAVQARPSRITKRRVSRSPSSSNRRGTKRQYIPCTPEATNIQPHRVITCQDSVSHISETPRRVTVMGPHSEQGTETEGHSQGAAETEEHPEPAGAGSSSNAADPPQSSP
ncbi:kinase-like domain-containing protein [Chaetomium tenue]|uniref:Kinase-like domain-containing protein n=1 Tax=Chaetomium tenue TaxID=1854479 RepID=A0ACB7PDI1_9PEZI|nr:kinase-like domain-containing protein [Chaetomium globosum]